MRDAAIHTLRERYPLSALISVREVSSSGYHEWRNRSPSAA